MTAEKTTILVVDDEEHMQRLLQRILERADYRVITVSDGYEAVEKVQSGGIDLVLLDIKMPGMNGFQTLKKIREDSEVPVIMVTGIGKVESVDTSVNLGADDYIKKPFRSNELVARIEAKLRRVRKNSR